MGKTWVQQCNPRTSTARITNTPSKTRVMSKTKRTNKMKKVSQNASSITMATKSRLKKPRHSWISSSSNNSFKMEKQMNMDRKKKEMEVMDRRNRNRMSRMTIEREEGNLYLMKG